MKMRQIVASVLALSIFGAGSCLAIDTSTDESSAGVRVSLSKASSITTINFAFNGTTEASITDGASLTTVLLDSGNTDLNSTVYYLKQQDTSQGTLATTFTNLQTSVDMPANQSYKLAFGNSNSSTIWDQFKFHVINGKSDVLTVSDVRKAHSYDSATDKTAFVYSAVVYGDASDAVMYLYDTANKQISSYSYEIKNVSSDTLQKVAIQFTVDGDQTSSTNYTALLFGKTIQAGTNNFVNLGADSIGSFTATKATNVVNDINVEDNLLVFDMSDEDGNIVEAYNSDVNIDNSFFDDNAPEEVAPEAEPSEDDAFIDDEFIEEEFVGEGE